MAEEKKASFSFGTPSTDAGSGANPFASFGKKADVKADAAKPATSLFSNLGGGSHAQGSADATQTTSSSAKPGDLFPTLGSGSGGAGSGTSTPSTLNPPSSGSLFPSSSTTSAPSSQGVFGGPTGFGFGAKKEDASGQSSNTTSGVSTPNKTTAPASSALTSAGNIFGGATAGASTGGSGTTGGLFGGLGSTTTASIPAGSTTPATAKPTLSFGNPSTTPAGPPPGGNSGLGATAGGGFSLGKASPSTGGGMFGGLNTAQSSAQEAPAATKASGLFGSTAQPPSGGLFGGLKAADKKAADSTTPSSGGSNLFGGGTAPSSLFGGGTAPSNLFGGGTAPSNLFAAVSKTKENEPPKPAASTPATTSIPSTGLFANLGQQGAKAAEPKPSGLFTAVSTPAASKPDEAPKSSLFGGLPSTSAAATSAAPASKPAFSFPSLGSTAQSQAGSSATAPATSSAAPSGLFGALASSTAASSAAATPASTTTAPGLFSALGNPAQPTSSAPSSAPATTSATSTPITSAPAPSFSFPAPTTATPSASAAPSASTATAPATTAAGATSTNAATAAASTSGPPPPPQSRLQNKSMEDIINGWAADLGQYQKQFQSQAEKVATWDRLLAENGEKIQKLYTSTFEAERASSEVERQLSLVEGQQDELSGWLDRYEREVDEMFSRQIGPGEGLQGPDQERERTYKLAERVSDKLDEMGKDLKSMIEQINDASTTLSKTSKTDDPLSQIVKILNSHLSSLQWIDQNASALQASVANAQKSARGLGMGNHGGHNGLGDDAASDFYRSFVGRR